MGVQPGEPRAVQEGPYEPGAGAGVAQGDPELRGGRRRRQRVDGARTRLGVDPYADRGGRERGRGPGTRCDQRVEPLQLLAAVGVDGDAEGEGLAQLGRGLGGGVQDRPRRRHPGGARQGQLAGAGHLAAQPRVREQPQYRHQRGGLDREGVQDGGAGCHGGGERAGQRGGGGADPGDVQQADQGRRGVRPAHQALLDGGPYGQVPALGGALCVRVGVHVGVRVGSHVRHPITRRARPQLLTESIQAARM